MNLSNRAMANHCLHLHAGLLRMLRWFSRLLPKRMSRAPMWQGW